MMEILIIEMAATVTVRKNVNGNARSKARNAFEKAVAMAKLVDLRNAMAHLTVIMTALSKDN